VTAKHERFMMRAIELAKKAEGKTFPNPMVGALIVKGGKIIAEGYHRKAGTPHAEVIALRKASRKAENADLYVSLEPCAHYGKTPPCTEAIIKSGVKKVYVAMKDPNPLVSGRGMKTLKSSGIKVKKNICRREAEKINKTYLESLKK